MKEASKKTVDRNLKWNLLFGLCEEVEKGLLDMPC